MDCSYIEEDSIHITAPYSSEPRWALNQLENIDEGEHQVSRTFESCQLDESELHHRYIPYWRIVPSKSLQNQSRPNTSILSVPLKKHALDESFGEEDDIELLVLGQNFSYYGKTGLVLYRAYSCESNLENKIIEEYLNDPIQLVAVVEKCKEFIADEHNMLNKILIDLTVQFWKTRDRNKLNEWVEIAKVFYSKQGLIFTNFCVEGILHFEYREEYLDYFEGLL